MSLVLGTSGYEESLEAFCTASRTLDFNCVNQEFLPYLPSAPARVLDLGTGIGQNAFALANLGFDVVAVEPLSAFLSIAKKEHAHRSIKWIGDALPELKTLSQYHGAFHFILMDGVWHHLSPQERLATMSKLASLLHANGFCGISLRHGHAGAGTHTFPTSVKEVQVLMGLNQLDCEVVTQNQASKLPNKTHVTWSKVIIKHRRFNAV
jgi:SAM-dependent methyltransferase